MNCKGRNYDELEKELLDRMIARGCSQVTITGSRYLCNSIINRMKGQGSQIYTKRGGNKILEDYLKNNGKNQYYEKLRTVVSRLNDLMDGTWVEFHSFQNMHFNISEEQQQIVDNYCNYCHQSGKASGTIKLKKHDTELFFSKLNESGCTNIAQTSVENISNACIRITDHNIWGEIRLFLRYLCDEGILPADYSTIVPLFSKRYVLPTVYSIEEIQKFESVIDRTTELGLRDYAMILFATRLGMRSGDIVLLKNEEVDFGNDKISIIQQKTKKKLELPLLPEIKEALLNYLTVRTGSHSNRIFLNVYAPYQPVTTGAMRYAVTKYLIMSGIDISSKKHGPHALRSSLNHIKHQVILKASFTGRGSLMNSEYKSVFKKEIATYMCQRKIELGDESYRHNKVVVLLFDNYLCKIGHQEKFIPMELMDEWIKSISSDKQKNTVGQYIRYIRQLMKYLVICGYRCVIPQNIVTRDSYSPYLYSDYELVCIFHDVDNFKAPKAVKNLWIEIELPMLLRLLYCCGLRVGEAVHLKMNDIDFNQGVITLRVTKKYKQRLVPIHNELTSILRDYCIAMGIIAKPNSYLFPGVDNDTPLTGNTIRNYYKRLLLQVGITREGYQPFERGVCVHCFRHVFTIKSFKLAEERGIKITDAVPFLSTYLGHDGLYETEKYLKFNGELFPDTTDKFEAYTDGIFPEVIINE